jgi:alkanesulfonate monooxygenase SsuD/methylene tetrahydromethanopterin reductase-like flavin-dependent oxidoreductase (luciferase family)
VRIGITLPQFRDDAEPAVEIARQAEAAGLDGVFVFDHLWRIARPDEPALHGLTLLGALAAETERVTVGTLVARIGLLPDAVLVHTFTTLGRMAGSRLIAGLGVGDAVSRSENVAYGVPFAPAAERRASLAACCRRLRSLSITTWVGGLSAGTRAVGRAEADGQIGRAHV